MNIKFYNQKYANDILGKAKTTTIPGLDWQDIAQELDIALWKNLNKFQGINSATERTFAVKVMWNKLLDLAKSANRKKRYVDSHHLLFSQLEETETGFIQLEQSKPLFQVSTYEY